MHFMLAATAPRPWNRCVMPAPLWLACMTLTTISQSLRCQDAPNPRTLNLNPLCVSVSLSVFLCLCICLPFALLQPTQCRRRSIQPGPGQQCRGCEPQARGSFPQGQGRFAIECPGAGKTGIELKQEHWRFEHPAFSDRRGLVLMYCQFAIR